MMKLVRDHGAHFVPVILQVRAQMRLRRIDRYSVRLERLFDTYDIPCFSARTLAEEYLSQKHDFIQIFHDHAHYRLEHPILADIAQSVLSLVRRQIPDDIPKPLRLPHLDGLEVRILDDFGPSDPKPIGNSIFVGKAYAVAPSLECAGKGQLLAAIIQTSDAGGAMLFRTERGAHAGPFATSIDSRSAGLPWQIREISIDAEKHPRKFNFRRKITISRPSGDHNLIKQRLFLDPDVSNGAPQDAVVALVVMRQRMSANMIIRNGARRLARMFGNATDYKR